MLRVKPRFQLHAGGERRHQEDPLEDHLCRADQIPACVEQALDGGPISR